MEEKKPETQQFRFAVMTLCFYGEKTILRMIDNCAPFVEKIYVGYSEVPWSDYNKNARSTFKAELSSDIFGESKWAHKIEVIRGEWPSDEAERNTILDKARQDGMDYLIVQDADEFYTPENFQKNLEGIAAHPNYPAYRCPWVVFWKNTRYVLTCRNTIFEKPRAITTCPNFAVNCNMPDVHFSVSRMVTRINEAFMLDGLCLHLSWVLDDEVAWKKVLTWAHSHQFNAKKWYYQKWLAWKPGDKNIGHISRVDFGEAIPFEGDLPAELHDFPAMKQQYVPLSVVEKMDSKLRDLRAMFVWQLRKSKHDLKRLIAH
jgi:hypothetical protein